MTTTAFQGLPLRVAFATSAVLGVLLAASLVFGDADTNRSIRADAAANIGTRHAMIAAGLAELFATVERRTAELSQQLADARPNREQITSMLRARVLHDPTTASILIALEPDNYLGSGPFSLFAAYSPLGFTVVDFYAINYDVGIRNWYRKTVDQNLSWWSDAYFNEFSGGQNVITYDVPLHLGDAGRGAVSLTLSLDRIETVATAMGFRRREGDERSVLMDARGRLIASWDPALELAFTVNERTAQRRDPTLSWFAESFKSSVAVSAELESADTQALLLSTPVGNSGWRIGSIRTFAAVQSQASRWRDLVLGLLGILIVAALLYLLTARLVGPLNVLAVGAERVALGDFDAALPTLSGRGEIARLGHAFELTRDRAREAQKLARVTSASMQALRSDVGAALLLQRALLPDDRLFFGGRLEVEFAGRIATAQSVAGDFYGFLAASPGICAFFIGNVEGRGLPAAMSKARLCTLFPALARQCGTPAEVLRSARDHLLQDDHATLAGCALVGRIDLSQGELQIATAAHARPLRLGVDGDQDELPLDPGPRLSADGALDWSVWQGQLRPGDRLVLFSNGLIQARDSSNQMFGLEGLQVALERHRELAPRNLADALIDEVRQHLGSDSPADGEDGALLIVELRHRD